MNPDTLRALQSPLKEKYRETPSAAMVVLCAESTLSEGISCRVDTGRALVEAGLHPATGGTGFQVCSGDMLLQALAACAGVTLAAVATSMGVALEDVTVRAQGDLDFRGTLGVSKDAPVGFSAIRLTFDLSTQAPDEQLTKLLELTERYCVVLQTLKKSPVMQVTRTPRRTPHE